MIAVCVKIGQAAKRSGLSQKKLRELCDDGVIQCRRLPGRGDRLILVDSLNRFLQGGEETSRALEIARSLGL